MIFRFDTPASSNFHHLTNFLMSFIKLLVQQTFTVCSVVLQTFPTAGWSTGSVGDMLVVAAVSRLAGAVGGWLVVASVSRLAVAAADWLAIAAAGWLVVAAAGWLVVAAAGWLVVAAAG